MNIIEYVDIPDKILFKDGIGNIENTNIIENLIILNDYVKSKQTKDIKFESPDIYSPGKIIETELKEQKIKDHCLLINTLFKFQHDDVQTKSYIIKKLNLLLDKASELKDFERMFISESIYRVLHTISSTLMLHGKLKSNSLYKIFKNKELKDLLVPDLMAGFSYDAKVDYHLIDLLKNEAEQEDIVLNIFKNRNHHGYIKSKIRASFSRKDIKENVNESENIKDCMLFDYKSLKGDKSFIVVLHLNTININNEEKLNNVEINYIDVMLINSTEMMNISLKNISEEEKELSHERIYINRILKSM